MKIKLDPSAYIPVRAHKTDAGLDLRAREAQIIPWHGSAVFDTGVHIALHRGYYGKIESKSGLNVHHNVVSCGGVIDEGYTGSIAVKLYNLGKADYEVHEGDKIAQFVVMPYSAPSMELVMALDDTERGAYGFGSTGR